MMDDDNVVLKAFVAGVSIAVMKFVTQKKLLTFDTCADIVKKESDDDFFDEIGEDKEQTS
jgi:hypothetical protein